MYGKMWNIVDREVNFGISVAYTISISAEQRAIETVASIDIPLGYLFENTLLFTFCSTA